MKTRIPLVLAQVRFCKDNPNQLWQKTMPGLQLTPDDIINYKLQIHV